MDKTAWKCIKNRIFGVGKQMVWMLMAVALAGQAYSQTTDTIVSTSVKRKIADLMKEGNIPGLSVVVIKQQKTELLSFGYADIEKKIPVSAATGYEIGSCSKAFTALAALKLEKQGLLDLEAPVTKYLPWLRFTHKGSEQAVKVKHFLHHTSGIPFKSISSIPEDSTSLALERTVKTLVRTELEHSPGEHYEYATINYDVIGLLIQTLSRTPYEVYMENEIFKPLALNQTHVATTPDGKKATGYKISFLNPVRYEAPCFRGNFPAGYVVSNAHDMAKWLKYQLGISRSALDSLIGKSHQPDLSVYPSNSLPYAFGWMVNLYEKPRVEHGGYNPNFTSYIELLPRDSIAVMVMANSNSDITPIICKEVVNRMYPREVETLVYNADRIDVMSTTVSIVLFAFCLFIVAFMIYAFVDARRKKTGFEKIDATRLLKLLVMMALCVPYLLAIYLIPDALIGFSWSAIFVWTPGSFRLMIYALLAALFAFIAFYVFSSLLKDKYKSVIPLALVLCIVSGLSNAAILFIITSSFYSKVSLGYLMFYFGLICGVYWLSSKVWETKMLKFTHNIVFNIRVFLMNKLINSKLENFEKNEPGRIMATFNDDTLALAGSANVVIQLLTNLITIFSAFVYMGTISLKATLLIIVAISLLGWYYYLLSNRIKVFIHKTRDMLNTYTGLLNGVIYGFKQISLHSRNKLDFASEYTEVSKFIRLTSIEGAKRFINARLVGGSLIIMVLGIFSIIMPRMSTNIDTLKIFSFVMVALYIINPINSLLESMQGIAKIKVAWHSICDMLRTFSGENRNPSFFEVLNFQPDQSEPVALSTKSPAKVKTLEVKNLSFKYKNGPDSDADLFGIGPLDLKISEGELVFIIGGNGSGKSTFINLLSGLYTPESGAVEINGQVIEQEALGEFFSVIFSNNYLFRKLYGIDLTTKKEEWEYLLDRLKMKHKVSIIDDSFSTIDLSSGQRKRLAILHCVLDDRPVFIFDEVAADQDPEFRRFFYEELLPEMKAKGKMVIAITHDDNYFSVADRIVKLDYGKIQSVTMNR